MVKSDFREKSKKFEYLACYPVYLKLSGECPEWVVGGVTSDSRQLTIYIRNSPVKKVDIASILSVKRLDKHSISIYYLSDRVENDIILLAGPARAVSKLYSLLKDYVKNPEDKLKPHTLEAKVLRLLHAGLGIGEISYVLGVGQEAVKEAVRRLIELGFIDSQMKLTEAGEKYVAYLMSHKEEAGESAGFS